MASTGWETFLDAVDPFRVCHKWHLASAYRKLDPSVGMTTNSLASSNRPGVSPSTPPTRRWQLAASSCAALRAELPDAVSKLQRGNVAPVDLAQAAIGPGMAIYTRYSKVLDAQGQPVTVREALALINQTLDEALDRTGRRLRSGHSLGFGLV